MIMKMKKIYTEHDIAVESILLNVCDKLSKIGEEMYFNSGNESYVERCHNHDAKMLIYGLTNKSNIEKMTYINWRENIQSNQ